MVRTQISLSEEQYRFLKGLSRGSGESMSELIRQALEELRRCRKQPVDRALEVLGAFQADREDVSLRHDDYFAEEAER
ncbi:MAG: ribbon-helix-helix protein, CopG family [Thermodesulfobacteriota bacterium]|jgi:Arc/MetJ-type ribon-helix-helix transcriptional regulator